VTAAPVGASEAAAAIPVAHVIQIQDNHTAVLDTYVANERRAAAVKAAAALKAKQVAAAKARQAAAAKAALAHRAAVNRAARAAAAAAARARAAARRGITHLYSASTARGIAQRMLKSFGWANAKQWSCLDSLWTRESHWSVTAGSTSHAYGIPQALPGTKMAS